MQIQSRSYTAPDKGYRFGFNGMYRESISEYQTECRQYNSLTGRWLSVDKVRKPWESRYVSMLNNPIIFNDPLGLDPPEKRNIGYAFKRFFRWIAGDAYKHEANQAAWKLQDEGYTADIEFHKNENGREYAKVTGYKVLGRDKVDYDENGNILEVQKKSIELAKRILVFDHARWVQRSSVEVKVGFNAGGHLNLLGSKFAYEGDAGSYVLASSQTVRQYDGSGHTSQGGLLYDLKQGQPIAPLEMKRGFEVGAYLGYSSYRTFEWDPTDPNSSAMSQDNISNEGSLFLLNYGANSEVDELDNPKSFIGLNLGIGGGFIVNGSINGFWGIEYYD